MKHLVAVLGLVVGLTLAADEASAQFGAARGKVKDEKGEPVVGATVVLENTDGPKKTYQIQTDDKGQYVQVGLRTQVYRITATKDGYQGSYVDYKIMMGTSTIVPDIVLRPAAVVAQEEAQQKFAKTQKAFAAAIELTQAEKWDEAQAAFEAILVDDPKLPEAYFNIGYIHRRQEDWATARDAYQKALELRPDYADAKLALADAYRELGEADKADAMLAEAAAGSEGNAEAQLKLAVSLMNESKIPEAVAALEKAVAADPELADAQFHLGSLLVGQGQIPQAIEHLEKYLALNPDNAQQVSMAEQLIAALKPKP